MTTRPSVGRRIAAAVLGVERPGPRSQDRTAPRDLPFGRRLLAAVLGVRAGDGARKIPVGMRAGTETPADPIAEAPSHSSTEDPTPPPVRTGAAERQDPPAPRATDHAAGPTPREEPPLGPEEPPSTPPPWRPPSPYEGGRAPLLAEDRPEYERILDEALRSAPHRPELAAVGQRLNPEQLRTMALNATALITAAAAPEYQHYVKVREETRRPAATREPGAAEPDAGGIGVVGVIVVLSPVLAGTSAALFLLIGYILKMFSPEPAIAQTMLNAGWVFGAVTAAAILVAAVGLLLTALRNTSSSDPGPHGGPSDEVARAREAWRDALLERGILPFLREALVDPATAAALPARMSNRGHVRPGLGSPDDRPPAGPRPGFGTPDFTSPDFGGPERQPE